MEHGLRPYSGDGCTITCTLLKPKSVGYITLKSANPADSPLIYANALQDKEDVQVLIDGVKLARKSFAQQPLKKHVGSEVAPGVSVQTDEQIESYVRSIAQTLYVHYLNNKSGITLWELAKLVQILIPWLLFLQN